MSGKQGSGCVCLSSFDLKVQEGSGVERKVDEAADPCLQYHTALCRTPGRGTQAGGWEQAVIHTVQGHGIHSPASMQCKQAFQVEAGTETCPTNPQQSVQLA